MTSVFGESKGKRYYHTAGSLQDISILIKESGLKAWFFPRPPASAVEGIKLVLSVCVCLLFSAVIILCELFDLRT